VHSYFQEKDLYVNTPIITGSDAEGAGEMFKVTALPFDGTPRTEDGKVNYKEDFFERNEFNGFWTIRRRNFRNGFRSDIHLWTYI
jgi:aspartyl/asparaginyl-tRNA synthetase